jgi:myo-inositol-1(or 4)-monophosphatase
MKNRYEFVVALAKEVGELVLKSREKHLDVLTKNNDPRDIVTNVDLESSEFISDKIRENFPGEAIYSEEATEEDVSSGSFWSIDPIDGTASFSRNVPHFAVVIAYVENKIPIVGAIYNPVTREMFSFKKGSGAYFNDELTHVSEIKKLADAHIFLRAGRNKELWDWGADAYRFLLGHANKTANFGSSALDMCFVGSGRIEASVYGNLTPIDIIAATGFVREAGGMVVGREGQVLDELSKDQQTVVVANSSEIINALKEGIKF